MIRYAAAFLAVSLPGLYLAVTNFHTQILPGNLIFSFADARKGVPFPGLAEVLLLELSFELLREAGVRMPGTAGNTIGIVGGLIVGQAAVSANLASPIVVIVVAVTALGTFSIPNEELSEAFPAGEIRSIVFVRRFWHSGPGLWMVSSAGTSGQG